ncbi:S26 family signal peptidase [uncultured Tateyamaria sp.]|uniref:S26 family signal peptidase n=1 Tax=uncultured Tateyamaria sp. TaxID=455651 RepID=UPI002621D667|nr:S26 family signal peptidase [uncultured Tateyamaria sp.]
MSNLTFSSRPKIGRARKAFGVGTLFFGISCLFVLNQFDIVLNASRSLEEPAYLMYERPVLLSYGVVVSAQMPDVLHSHFGEYQFVKRIGGMPGDEITLDADGNPCVNDICYPLWVKDDAPIAPVVTAGIIPPDHYAVFGTAPDSLDSRYDIIGLISKDRLIGRGWPLPFMADWREGTQ